MRLVGEFFKKFGSLSPPHDSIKKEIVSTLKDTTNISVDIKQVTIRNGIVFIRIPSVIKNVIHIRRGEILKTLYGRLPKAKEVVRDIR